MRYQILDAYLGVDYIDRSREQLNFFTPQMHEELKQIARYKERLKKKTPELPLSFYTGTFNNDLFGGITVSESGNRLVVNFGIKPDLNATLDYMDNGEWLIQYNNIEYGIFPTRFKIENGKVKSVNLKVNDFVEYDTYEFVKK